MLATEKEEFRIHCQEPWLSYIQKGIKRIEGRKNSPKYQDIKKGDIILFYNETRAVKVKVTGLTVYKTLEDYLIETKIENVLPGTKSLKEALEVYQQWSTKEEIDTLGFLAIHIEALQSNSPYMLCCYP